MDTPLVSGVRVSFQLSQFLQEKLRARDYNMFYCHFYSEIYRKKQIFFSPKTLLELRQQITAEMKAYIGPA